MIFRLLLFPLTCWKFQERIWIVTLIMTIAGFNRHFINCILILSSANICKEFYEKKENNYPCFASCPLHHQMHQIPCCFLKKNHQMSKELCVTDGLEFFPHYQSWWQVPISKPNAGGIYAIWSEVVGKYRWVSCNHVTCLHHQANLHREFLWEKNEYASMYRCILESCFLSVESQVTFKLPFCLVIKCCKKFSKSLTVWSLFSLKVFISPCFIFLLPANPKMFRKLCYLEWSCWEVNITVI